MVTFKDLKDYPVDILFGEPPFNPLQNLMTYRRSSVELKNKQKEKQQKKPYICDSQIAENQR